MNHHNIIPIFLIGLFLWIALNFLFASLHEGRGLVMKLLVFWIALISGFLLPFSPIQWLLDTLNDRGQQAAVFIFVAAYFLFLTRKR
jgi:hypothetical protein